ncbi:MAG: ParB N-terminal domain-containing protein, partial [Bacteroidales bacterium]|nr:ParB N-terminal domain-containing protein [Bacteroidales bacterium]
MAKKNVLGKGLDALIESVDKDALVKKVEVNKDIPIDAIEANPFQPRTVFDEQALSELSASIKNIGIVQPLTVRELGNGKYQ